MCALKAPKVAHLGHLVRSTPLSQINAYHVAGSLSTVRTPIFDTGCTDHLFSAERDPYMTNTSKSPLSIGRFSGPEKEYQQDYMERYQHLWYQTIPELQEVW